jgi:AraC-like DNA-binding protein
VEAMAHYLRLQNEAFSMRIEEAQGIAIIRGDLAGDVPGAVRQGAELAVGVMYRLLLMFLGPSWKPRAVCFSHHAPASLATHHRVFGSRVEFGQEFDGIVCLSSELDAAMPTYDPGIAQAIRQHLDSMLVQSNAGMTDKVRQLVLALLPSGECSVERVAQHLGVDRRTVHRHLALADENFSSIVDAVRVELIMRYIDSRERSLSGVATLLGFSSLSAFSRWFHGRFGCSVTAWRKQHAH